jgi:hypothetical protein
MVGVDHIYNIDKTQKFRVGGYLLAMGGNHCWTRPAKKKTDKKGKREKKHWLRALYLSYTITHTKTLAGSNSFAAVAFLSPFFCFLFFSSFLYKYCF